MEKPIKLTGSKARLHYIDYFRALIIFLMIQGHLLRAVLDQQLKSGLWFNVHEYIHGVVAPGFLFLSGYLFYFTVKKKSSPELFKKMKSYFGVVLIGYFLHLPFFSLNKIVALWGTGIEYKFLYMDILQTIGYSLIISVVLWIILKRFFIPIISLLIIFNLLQCYLQIHTDNFFFSFFFDQRISQFPLFPWSLFFFSGIIVSRFIKRFNLPLFAASILLLFIAPNFNGSFSKLISDMGKLLFLFSILINLPNHNFRNFNKFLIASRESLFLYVSHMMIIYGSVLNRGLVFYKKDSLNPISFLIYFLIILILLYPSAYFLNILKNRNKRVFNIVKYGGYTLFFLIFILRKF